MAELSLEYQSLPRSSHRHGRGPTGPPLSVQTEVHQQVYSSLSVAKMQSMSDWDSGFCDCFEDANTCCYGFWCCPCLACTVSEKFGENRYLPLCDILGPAAFAGCGIPLVVPPAGLSLRAAIRNRYNIKGSLCKDIAAVSLCSWCSWWQMHRELKRRTQPTVINMQLPQSVASATTPPSAGFVIP
ncbi:cornifelin-like [Mastacembelus armatus]|uniref:Cornifelin-like n=1 Tax=Mastacembelus armatus TaxID=205130 RepID=A0A7N9AX23_9TELE|nr:cornifelin-like [Mastacembelus armatus]